MGLGTGGYALVVALPDRLPADPPDGPPGTWSRPGTPRCSRSCSAPTRRRRRTASVLADADDLAGMPVVTADLHSALPAVLAGVRADRPDARVAYVMTDGGALPAWFSRTLDGLRGRLARRHGHRRPGVRRRPGGDQRAQRPARRPARARRRRGDRRRRARATWAPAPRGGSPAWRSARRSTRSRRWAAVRSARCASPTPTRGRGTGASPPQPHRVRPGGAGAAPTWWCPTAWPPDLAVDTALRRSPPHRSSARAAGPALRARWLSTMGRAGRRPLLPGRARWPAGRRWAARPATRDLRLLSWPRPLPAGTPRPAAGDHAHGGRGHTDRAAGRW